MAQVYQTKINRILGDGARATKFAITGITDPFDTNQDKYLIIKTAQFPGKFHDVIDFKYKGRNIPIKGQTRYDNTWSCSFYLEESHDLRDMFMNWIEALDQQHNMSGSLPRGVIVAKNRFNFSTYTSTITLVQVNFDDDTQPTASYQLYNAFPKSISAIELDYSNTGTILEYTVEFSYSHFNFIPYDQISGNIIDSLRQNFLDGVQGIVGSIKGNITNILGGAINSAKSNFTSTFNSNNISGSTLPAIGNSISGAGSSLLNGAGSIFKGVDFNPMKFISK